MEFSVFFFLDFFFMILAKFLRQSKSASFVQRSAKINNEKYRNHRDKKSVEKVCFFTEGLVLLQFGELYPRI